MQPVGAAHVFLAGAFGVGLGLLLGPAEREPGNRRQAVDENSFVLIEILRAPPIGLEVGLANKQASAGSSCSVQPIRHGKIARRWPVVEPDRVGTARSSTLPDRRLRCR